MTTSWCHGRGGWIPAVLALGFGGVTGCSTHEEVGPVRIANRFLGSMTIAVAPAINLSGSVDFDADRFADVMAVELGYADGISVIPVSRVLAVLARQGIEGVESPSHALELSKLLGADGILVFAVNEYDPYDPPRIGISAQLYGARDRTGGGSLDPVALSRQATLAGSTASGEERGLLSQSQRVFDASHNAVASDIRDFARKRGAGGSAYGWRKYVVSQQNFIGYCCYATIRALLSGEDETGLAEMEPREVRMP